MDMTVDRIEKTENGYVTVCETDNGTETIFTEEKPDYKTGDILIRKNGGYIVDSEKTQKRRQEIIDLQNDLFE